MGECHVEQTKIDYGKTFFLILLLLTIVNVKIAIVNDLQFESVFLHLRYWQWRNLLAPLISFIGRRCSNTAGPSH